MLSFLASHAMKNVWCAPRQDMQSILKPKRVTDKFGVMNVFELGWKKYALPEIGKKFHVYQIGQLNPELIGLRDTNNKWLPINEVMQTQNMIFEIYTAKGVMIPRFTSYFRFTDDKNLLIAVRENKAIPWEMIDEPIYFRVYSGAYFKKLRINLEKDAVVSTGRVFLKKQDRIDMVDFYNEYKSKPGYLYIWVNGWLRDVFDAAKFKDNDIVEMLYDSTIYKKLSVKLTDLNTFDSILDEKTKYLITYSGNKTDLTVDFFDDIDFYIKRKRPDESENKGAYFHRNNVDAIRQLTHRDYSICVPYISYLVKNNSFFENETDIYIDITIRKSGLDRKLIFVENRIHELYKLDDIRRVTAMLGVRSNVDVWRADNLENSKYMKLMSSEELIRDDEFIAEAYGYNAIAMLTGYTPTTSKDFLGNELSSKINLPYNLQLLAACYEYDKDGKFLEIHNNRNGCTYPIRNIERTDLVECISGYASEYLDDVYNPTNHMPTYDYVEYRVYRCPKGKESDLKSWEDITGKLDYVIKDKEFNWLNDQSDYTTLVRSDRNILDYELLIDDKKGYFSFNIIQKVFFNNTTQYVKMFVPMGHLDIYLNGYSLVEGVDYILDFPKVMIISKRYLNNPTEQKQNVHIRFSSFCQSDLSLLPVKQKGYVKHNTISLNKKYDIKDDKILRFVIAGQNIDRNVLGFSEDNTEIKIPYRIKEGSPYLIRDIIVPYRGLTTKDTYRERSESERIDKDIEDYLGQFITDKEYDQPAAIEKLYPLYSPFISALIKDFKNNVVNFNKLTAHYNDNEVIDYMKKYEWLLDFDPVKSNNTFVDYEYCIVHPLYIDEVVTVDVYQYKFIEAVVRLYMEGKVKLSHFLKIGKYNGNGN